MLVESGDVGGWFQKKNILDFFIGPVFFYRNPPRRHLWGRVRASFCRERRLLKNLSGLINYFKKNTNTFACATFFPAIKLINQTKVWYFTRYREAK
jgi:hypothetical protein